MAVDPSIVINLAAEFTGKKAFTQSEKAIDKLGKRLKQAVIGAGVASLLKSSVNAFIAEEKSAAILANTLQNLGFEKLTGDVEKFIGQSQLATGVLDDKLRPAFQALLTATRDVAKSQKLMQLALNVSAGSSVDLETVTSDLANAYAGNMKGLKKYKLGLTQAELKVISFTDLQTRLNSVFAGASAKAADTYAGKLARLGVAVDQAKESIGKGIIDGLMTATGTANIEELQRAIISFGDSAGSVFKSLGGILKENLTLIKTIGVSLAAIWTLSKISAAVVGTITLVKNLNRAYKTLRATAIGTAIAEMAVLNPLGAVAYAAVLVGLIAGTVKAVDLLGDAYDKANEKKDALLNKPATARRFFTGGSGNTMSTGGRNLADEAAAKKNAKETLKVNKDTLKLAKAKAIFDIQKIQIEAALKGKISDEDRIRLKLMQAIEDENITQIDKYTKMLSEAQAKTLELVTTLQSIKPMGDIFQNWNFMSVKEQLASLDTYFRNFAGSAASAFNALSQAQQAALGGYVPFVGAKPNVPSSVTDGAGASGAGMGTNGTGNQTPTGVTVQVTVQGSVIAENDLNQAINDALAASGWAGSAIGYGRQAVITAV